MDQFINEKLGGWLLQNGNTRERLAQELNMTRPTLNGRLEGKTKWLWGEVVAISRLVGCSLNELAGIS